jgi:hypothetical protein
MALHHYVMPHRHTHHKAHLLRWHAILSYLLLFIFLQVFYSLVNIYQPGVLGVNSNISIQEVISGTNSERAKLGLSPLRENSALNQAAAQKAANMFSENYWAHYSPSGKDPWDFITAAGYRYSFAGENLAKNFENSNDVVVAWMNSPTHRDNIVNPNYQEIGIAVMDGTLQGQKTTLVVQMFGKPYAAVAKAPTATTTPTPKTEVAPISQAQPAVQSAPAETAAPTNSTTQDNNQAVEQRAPLTAGIFTQSPESITAAIINPYVINRVFGFGLLALIGSLMIVDILVLRRRGVFRVSSHHVAHVGLILIVGGALLVIRAGNIL